MIASLDSLHLKSEELGLKTMLLGVFMGIININYLPYLSLKPIKK